jgi:hypothetical protein
MSRSRRAPIWTCGYGSKEKRKDKARANNRVKQADVASGGAYKKVSNSWDICDYKIWDEKSSKARRK